MVSRRQLLEAGLHPQAITHRLTKGRLHPVFRGVYAVGRPELSRSGRWMAAVLSCGPGAALSHASAASLHGIPVAEFGGIEVSVFAQRAPRRPGIVVHRRALGPQDLTLRHGIPVTTPICTLVDLALRLGPARLEAAINEAVKGDLTDPDALRTALDGLAGRAGAARLRETLDRRTFRLTDSELERRFLRLVARSGLPTPATANIVNGFRVDFHWAELGLVVETDGLRYHSTPAQQTKDRQRDQVHAASGLTSLRFTHAQVRFSPGYLERTLAAVARRLEAQGRSPRPL